eukprot:61270-Hanusia_phi.AAC.2
MPGKHRLQEDVVDFLRCAQGAGDEEREHADDDEGWMNSLQVCIVSRNPHKQEIEEMLRQRGVEEKVEVCCVKVEGTTKARKIVEKMSEKGGIAVYADDDVRELVDSSLIPCTSLHRVIFSFRELNN